MITGTFTTAVGDISITMDDGGAGAYVEVSKLGNLKYEFDQTPDSVQIDRTIALYSYIQVVFESLTESSEDLYTRLVDATDTTPINCTLSIDNFGVDTFDFSFELKQENIDYNEKEGTVAVRFTPKIDKEVTISNVVRSVTNYDYRPLQRDSDSLSITNLNCLPVVDFLDKGMQTMFGNSFDAFIKPSKNASNVSYFKSNATWSDNDPGLVIVDSGDVVFPNNENTYGDPVELATTANVTANTVYSLYNIDVIAGTQDVLETTTYKVEATDILNEFPVGSAIGWFFNDEIRPPIRIARSQSTQNIVVSVPFFNQFTTAYTGTPPANIDNQFLTGGRIFAYTPAVNTKVSDTIKELAGIEGSIYGTGFSKNFYVHRLSDNDTEYVTLNYDLVSEIKQKKLNKFLQATVVRQVADYDNNGFDQFGQIPTTSEQSIRLPNVKGAGAFVRGNENASKSLEINLAPVYPYLNKASKSSGNYISVSLDTIASETSLERSITSAGSRAYSQALNQESGGLKIELTYLDALALKPYELFQFDSTAPEKYQNKQYRITSISYDFIKNESKIVGYQINSLATPVVEQPVTPPVTPPDDGNEGEGDNEQTTLNLLYKPGWNFISNPTQETIDVIDVFGNDYVTSSLYQYAGGYINDGTTDSLPSNTNASLNERSPGYVVKLKDDIVPTYYSWPGEVNDSNVTNIQIYQGWNLIGSLGVPSIIQSNSSNGAGINPNTIFRFDGSYITAGTTILPGFSHWVYSSNNGAVDLIVSQSGVLSVNLQNEFKQVQINEDDVSVSVYFDGTNTNTNVNIQEAFLPPPIGSTFDVRINADETNTALRDLRAVESNTINIDVQQIDSATTLNISPSIFYYVSGATDASPSHTTDVYTSLSGYSLACSCSIYETGSLYYTTGPAPLENFQATFLDGDKIITAQNIVESTPVDVPITTTRIQLKPMGADIKLPVRARDIANDDYVLTAKYDRVGTAQTGDASETVIKDSLFGVYDTDNDYKIEIGYRTNVAPVPQIFLDDTARNTSGANSLTISYDSIGLTTLTDGNWLVKNGAVTHEYSTIEETVELASFATNQDDYSIGKGTVFTIQTSASPSAEITGIAGGVDGRIIHLTNRGNRNIVFVNDSSNSSAANRFYFFRSLDLLIEQWNTISLRYVGGSINRWIRQEG